MRQSVRQTPIELLVSQKSNDLASQKKRKALKRQNRPLPIQPGLLSETKYLSFQGQILYGIRKALKKTFWPNFDHPTAKRKSQLGVTKKDGLRVEKQISQWHKSRQKRNKKPKDPSLNYARLFCAWLRANHYEIVASQHPILDNASGIGTRIDFILCDTKSPQKDLLLVELKVGYNYCFNKQQGMMKNLKDVPCTLRNQCYFQLAWMDYVVRQENIFEGHKIKPLLVVLTNSLVKRAKVGKKPVEKLAKELRKSKPQIAFPLPALIKRHQTLIHSEISRSSKRSLPSLPIVIDLTV